MYVVEFLAQMFRLMALQAYPCRAQEARLGRLDQTRIALRVILYQRTGYVQVESDE
jgi:hypothetical protein